MHATTTAKNKYRTPSFKEPLTKRENVNPRRTGIKRDRKGIGKWEGARDGEG